MKKGFTLIELLSVIVVIGVISLIIFPLVSNQIGQSREDLYNAQVENIIKAAKSKALEEENILESAKYAPTYITIEQLQNKNNTEKKAYLESETIQNPKNDNIMNGAVKITYDSTSNSYIYEYLDELPEGISSSQSLAAQYILSKNDNIYTNENNDGLYEDVETNTYYFKGLNPNNYIRFSNDSDNIWNIISINKETNEVKIARMIPKRDVSGVWSSTTGLSNITLANADLGMRSYLNGETFLTDEIRTQIKETSSWNIGEVSATTKTLNDLKVEETSLKLESRVGLLSISDYAYATTKLSCRKDYQEECPSYLVPTEGEYFLMNTVKKVSGETSDDKVWTLSSSGLTNKIITSELTIYPVVILKASAIISEGDGKSTNPYIIKVN